jgi:hypothetical protein
LCSTRILAHIEVSSTCLTHSHLSCKHALRGPLQPLA